MIRTMGIVLVAASSLSGCAHWSLETRALQTAYLAVHAVDAAQTLTIARNPDTVHEVREAWLIGEQPSRGAVAAWAIGGALLHVAVTDQLERRDAPRWLRRSWQAFTIGPKVSAVTSNHELGIRLDGLTRELRDRCRGRDPGTC
jgi:hypothetical protein